MQDRRHVKSDSRQEYTDRVKRYVRYVPYYRVSAKNQGKSRLDPEAQRVAAHRFVGFNGGEIIAGYTEVETEADNRHRPVLREAAGHARSAGACLVIAKLDRLLE